MPDLYYVYEHWRLDKDECFYVGKGKKARAYSRKDRNRHWKNIVSKLERLGFGYEVRMVKTGLTEKEAFNLEKERISFWKDIVDLCNRTFGGEGVSGLIHSEETKKLISSKKKGFKLNLSEEVKRKQRERIPYNKGKPGLSGENHPMYGKKHTEETRALMSSKKIGKPAHNKGKASPLRGIKRPPRSLESRLKQSETRKAKGIIPWNKKTICETS